MLRLQQEEYQQQLFAQARACLGCFEDLSKRDCAIESASCLFCHPSHLLKGMRSASPAWHPVQKPASAATAVAAVWRSNGLPPAQPPSLSGSRKQTVIQPAQAPGAGQCISQPSPYPEERRAGMLIAVAPDPSTPCLSWPCSKVR